MVEPTPAFLDGTPVLVALADLFGIHGGFADQAWRARAACRGQDPEWWFPTRGADSMEQRRVCAGCEVRLECLDFALAGESVNFGIWGGTSGRERCLARRRGWDAARLIAELRSAGEG